MAWNLGLMGAAGGAGAAYELIASAVGNGSSGSITFLSIPSTYKHLQIRCTVQDTGSSNQLGLRLRINESSDTNYNGNYIQFRDSNQEFIGSSSLATFIDLGVLSAPSNSSYVGAAIIDFVDYASTVKGKAVRSFGGNYTWEPRLMFNSGSYREEAPISSIQLYIASNSFTSNTKFALYGIKG